MAKMLKIEMTTISADGDEKTDIVEVAEGTPFRGVLKQAMSQGFDFSGYGILSINGKVVPKNQTGTTLSGKITRNISVRFVRQNPDQSLMVDLDSMR